MDMKKLAAGTVLGALALFASGGLIYEVLFGDATFFKLAGAEAMEKDPLNMGGIVVMELLFGALLTIIYSRWASISTFMTGMKNGAWFGAFIGATVGLDYFSVFNYANINVVWFLALTYAVRFALAGGAVGWVLGKVGSDD